MPDLETAIHKALHAKSTTAFGFWLTLPSAAVARSILRPASTSAVGGFSWVLIDAEHGLISDKDYYELVNAVSSEGASPIIRVPWPEEWLIKRALDAGAHGVMTPMCHSEEDALKIVQFSKYPPRGSRGYGPSYASHSIAGVQAGKDYDEEIAKDLLVVVQIESRSGLDNIEAIAKVDGIDVIFIGPFDLAKQMRVTRGGEEHEAAIQRILKATQAAGKTAAIYCTDGKDAHYRAKQGFNMVSVAPDQGVLSDAMLRTLEMASEGKAAGPRARDTY